MRILQTALAVVVLCGAVSVVSAQELPATAFTNVTIHTHDGKKIEKASVVWRNGAIQALGAGISIPFDAKIIDGGDSLHVYPGFIDGLADWGTPDLPRQQAPVPDRGNPPYERAGIQPNRTAHQVLDADNKHFDPARKLGFTTAGIVPKGYMLAGQLDVFNLVQGTASEMLFADNLGQRAAFTGAPGVYPGTLMALMSKYRQLWNEATALQEHIKIYTANPSQITPPTRDVVLESLFPVLNKQKPLFFSVDNKEDIERVLKLQAELGFNWVMVSGKEAYRLAPELAKRKIPVLLSLNFPEQPKWKTELDKAKADSAKARINNVPDDVKAFREKQLKAWEEHADNMKTLLDAGVKVGFATDGMKLADLAKKIEVLKARGVEEATLVRVMTVNTAEILGLDKQLGRLANGQVANLAVFSKPFTDKKAKIMYTVAKGQVTDYTQSK